MLSICTANPVSAHLMVAQHGTLNFLNDSVYMVLSLPASAFSDADEDNDGLLSLTEFSTHRTELIIIVTQQVTLSNKTERLPIDGLMISPVTPHDAPKEPAEQIIIMGRFILNGQDSELSFHIGLFGVSDTDQSLVINASRKEKNQTQVFELSPKSKSVKLSFN